MGVLRIYPYCPRKPFQVECLAANQPSKQTADCRHPTFVDERDSILEEVSVLIQAQVRHVDDLENPYALAKFEERKQRIRELLDLLEKTKEVYATPNDEG
jgi:hypothetical protein